MNRSKARGTRFEGEVIEALQRSLGPRFPHVDRRVQHGSKDTGDVAGIDGWVIEVKNCKAMALGEWMKEAEVEAANALVTRHAVVHKRRMKGADEAYATVPLWLLGRLIAESASPNPLGSQP